MTALCVTETLTAETEAIVSDRQSFAQQMTLLLSIRGMTRNRFADATCIPVARVSQFLSPDWSTPENPDPSDDELTAISKALDIDFSRLDGWLACDFFTMARYKSQHRISDRTQAEKDERRAHWTEVARQEAKAAGLPFVSRDERRQFAAERAELLQAA